MSRRVRLIVGILCLGAAGALVIVSFNVRNEDIRWYSAPALVCLVVSGVLLRQSLRSE